MRSVTYRLSSTSGYYGESRRKPCRLGRGGCQGVVAAAVFALLLPVTGFESVSLTNDVLYGLGWGFVLFVGAAVFWMNLVLDMDPAPANIGFFLLFHLIYGGVLGALVGYGLV